MFSNERRYYSAAIIRLVKRRISMLLIAFMLGLSNVILEESRMVNDTREHIEQQEITPEDKLDDTLSYWSEDLGAF
ncbi:hypothetical protein FGM00_13585 [Aggregatimonas sangjinii]|uniref:Uncharacterized protein n=1 Tax=Aggregatimonas sangjinii TaxID=2583587 RepID=A0A5B7SR48_9FLAO|nr:hypothetical protein [Aggregatimonas sangjinii]QCX01096.1 hypothetical protein FGM00_13585 [Aggregatimonas sangjinii]